MRLLVARTDKLGDLLVSLPALQLLRRSLPDAKIIFLAQPHLLPVVGDYLQTLQMEAPGERLKLGEHSWDAFTSLANDPELSVWAWRKRIPLRVGAYSKFWSYVVFNAGVRQKRARAEQHEGQYTEALVSRLLEKLGKPRYSGPLEPITLPVDVLNQETAAELISDRKLNPKKFIVLHPGMAGSALNLSLEAYCQIVEGIQKTGVPILISEGPSPEDKRLVGDLSRRYGASVLRGQTLAVIKEVFRMAEWVIAPSTGPLHLAHYVGTSTVGIYPPILNQHPRRWRPFGGSGKSVLLYPTVECPAKRTCWGEKCRYFSCMEKHDWASLILGALDG